MSLNPKIREKQAAVLQWEVNNRTHATRAESSVPGVGTACVYSHSVNGGCAVGRLLPEEVAAKLRDAPCSMVFDNFPDNVQELELPFLINLQRLHDTRDNWDSTGLSPKGIDAAKEIADKFGLTINFSKYEPKPES